MASKSSDITAHPPQKSAPRSRDAQGRRAARTAAVVQHGAGAGSRGGMSPAGPAGLSRCSAAAGHVPGKGQRRLPFLLLSLFSWWCWAPHPREVSWNEAVLAELPQPQREPRAAGSAGPLPLRAPRTLTPTGTACSHSHATTQLHSTGCSLSTLQRHL